MINPILVNVLVKLRDETIAERDDAANPGSYLSEDEYNAYTGRELAFDEVIYKLNKLIQEHSEK